MADLQSYPPEDEEPWFHGEGQEPFTRMKLWTYGQQLRSRIRPLVECPELTQKYRYN